MTNLHPDLKKTLTDSGIPDDCPLLDYLDWAGIRTKNSLAMFFDESDKIDPWIHRFANKTTFGTPAKEIHYPEEDRRKGLLACFIAAWTECSDDLAQNRAAKLPATAPTIPSIPEPPPAPQMTRYPRHGQKEFTNNSSPTTRTRTHHHSQNASYSEQRKSLSECGTNIPHPKTIRPWDSAKSSPSEPSPRPDQ